MIRLHTKSSGFSLLVLIFVLNRRCLFCCYRPTSLPVELQSWRCSSRERCLKLFMSVGNRFWNYEVMDKMFLSRSESFVENVNFVQTHLTTNTYLLKINILSLLINNKRKFLTFVRLSIIQKIKVYIFMHLLNFIETLFVSSLTHFNKKGVISLPLIDCSLNKNVTTFIKTLPGFN